MKNLISLKIIIFWEKNNTIVHVTRVLEENLGVSAGEAVLTVNVVTPLHNSVDVTGSWSFDF